MIPCSPKMLRPWRTPSIIDLPNHNHRARSVMINLVIPILSLLLTLIAVSLGLEKMKARVLKSQAFSIGNGCYIVRMKVVGSDSFGNYFGSIRADGFLLMPIDEPDPFGEITLNSELPIDLFVPSGETCSLAFIAKRISSIESSRFVIRLRCSNRMLSIKANTEIANTPDPISNDISAMNDLQNFQKEQDKNFPGIY